MKVKCTGKVLSRTSRKAPDGSTRYTIAIEEPGNIPSTFAFSTKNAAVFGPSDGFAKVGNIVTATAFANGRCEDVPRKDGSGTFKKFNVYFTLSMLEPFGHAAQTVPPAGGAVQAAAPAADFEDIPF